MTQKFFANELEVHPSTICRELSCNIAKRGRTSWYYIASNAQRKTEIRYQGRAKQSLFSDSMRLVIIRQLEVDKCSLEIISQMGLNTGNCPISHV